jgi:hypothetical protein
VSVRTLAIATALILSAHAAAAQDRPAGETRPKLQVLQDVPESQLFMAMNVVAESLGVDCAHCHVRNTPGVKVAGGWQWDSDDKPAKARGREMMRMVRDLNAARFGGRLVVTCFTCHRGDLRVVNLPPVPPPDPRPPAPALPSAADVLAKYVAAVGGPGAATRFGTIVMEGREERPEGWYEPEVGRRGPVKIVFKGRDRFRQDFTVPPEPARSQVVTGSSGWAARGETVVALPADAVERVRRTVTIYSPLKVTEPVERLRVERIERIGSRDAYVVSVATGAANTRAYFFDTTTGLLIREHTTTPMALVPLQQQIEYDDYRSVDGIMLPFTVRTSDDAQYDTSTRTFTSIRHDVAVDDAVFVMPPPKQ